jgi:asparagine synthase (glutamine-hydrolysing)
MCGLAGVLILDDKRFRFDRGLLDEMVGCIRHRGPDYSGTVWDGPCGLGHSRLSIIDLSPAARQPMTNEDATVTLAYNGEVYNFRDLRRDHDLDRRGHRFRSESDTEVIIHLFEESGIDCVSQLNGMFAFALWDSRNRTLYLARDPFGIKPLFYTSFGGALWFASEIKSLLKIPGLERRVNPEALHHYLSFDYIPGHLTAFAGIAELPPGHLLEISAGDAEMAIRPFFQMRYPINEDMDVKTAVDETRRLASEAVARHLISDVPVGVMLSGGLDSSALTALMAEIRGNADFHTFSLTFDDPSFNEGGYARMVAEELGTHHHEIPVTPQKVAELLPKYLTFIDEPYADGSAIPTFLLAEQARDFVTVLLSGEGGDEFFSGYDTHMAYKVRRYYRKIPRCIRSGLITPLVNSLPVSHRKLSLDFKAKRFVRGAELDVPNSHFFWRMVLSEDAKREILARREGETHWPPSVRLFEEAYERCQADDELNRLLFIDFSYHLPDDLMIKNDRMTMAHSLEARVPFTDRNLVEFLASVPVNIKFRGRQKKYLLKAAMAGMLPEPVLKKKKIGLEMPYSRWMIHELRDIAEQALSSDSLKAVGLFNPEAVRRIWSDHLSKRVDHGRALWGLVNFILWHQVYIEKRIL